MPSAVHRAKCFYTCWLYIDYKWLPLSTTKLQFSAVSCVHFRVVRFLSTLLVRAGGFEERASVRASWAVCECN